MRYGKTTHEDPYVYRHGDHFRLDGKPEVLRIGKDGAHLVSLIGNREHPVDALELTVLTACGRLVRHNPRTPPRRGPRGGTRTERGNA